MNRSRHTLTLHGTLLGLMSALALAGCEDRSNEDSARTETPQAALEAPVATAPPERSMNEFMNHVVSFSAFNIWNRQGWITDAEGTHSLFPKNEEEWVEAESAAQTLDEVVKLLQLPNRRIDVPGWDESALRVRNLAKQAAEAARNHDESEFFRIGAELEGACEDCHVAMGLVTRPSE